MHHHKMFSSTPFPVNPHFLPPGWSKHGCTSYHYRWGLFILELCTNETTQYVLFCVWLLSLKISIWTSSMLLHVSRIHFFNRQVIFHQMHIRWLLYLLGAFFSQFLAIMNKISVNICVQIFVGIYSKLRNSLQKNQVLIPGTHICYLLWEKGLHRYD